MSIKPVGSATAYCLSIHQAVKEMEPEKINLKQYKRQNANYKKQSVFRLGLSLLLRLATSFEAFCQFVLRLLFFNDVCPNPKTAQ